MEIFKRIKNFIFNWPKFTTLLVLFRKFTKTPTFSPTQLVPPPNSQTPSSNVKPRVTVYSSGPIEDLLNNDYDR